MNKGAKHYYKRKWYAINKLGGKCCSCGKDYDLNFDHIKPDSKIANVSLLLTHKLDTLDNELSKCQLLCVTCHKLKTKINHEHAGGHNKGNFTHGTSGYRIGCRCAKCKYEYSCARKERYRRLKK